VAWNPVPARAKACTAGTFAVLALTLSACRMPWTIRAIESQESASTGAPFDAAKFAAAIWDSQVVPAASAAPEFAWARGARGPMLVKGTGRVLEIDRSRNRLLLDVAPFDGKPDAELATGQIHGTALRDSLPFVQFSQFVNQVDFAYAANALDDRAAAAASAALAGVTTGRLLFFAGALDPGSGGLPEIVPVILSRGAARP